MSDISLSHKKHRNDNSDFTSNCGLIQVNNLFRIQNNMILGMYDYQSHIRNYNNNGLHRCLMMNFRFPFDQ